MSLDISPGTPSTSHRPLPLSRSKRRSLLASTPSPAHGNAAAKTTAAHSTPPSRSAGMMGGLRERTEDELRRASREAIEEALREEWEVRDRLLQKVDQLESEAVAEGALRKELETNLKLFQSRSEDSTTDQTRLETDLMERDEMLERLRERLSQAEVQTREMQKRASEQETAFDAERQALQAQESHLQQRIRTLLAAKPSPSKSSSIRPDDALSDLQEELATLNVSHSTLLAQLNTVSKELSELRQVNAVLQEENEGWEFLVRERTFAGKLRDMSEDHAAPNHDTRARRSPRGQLEALDEELEMDELHSELEAQSPILDDAQMYITDLDVNDTPGMVKSPSGHLAAPTEGRRPKGESLGDLPLTSSGLDLAAELGRAEVDMNGNEMRVLGKGDEGEAMRAEIKNLREANKALTLYCSKIIDRIITQEGFEQVLSVDYKTRRLGSRSASGPARGSLLDITATMQEQNIPPDPPAAMERKNSVTKKARPLSFFGRATTTEQTPEPAAPVMNEPAPEVKSEKGARRRFSLDLRSLGFGGPSLTSPAEPKPNPALRPLTLAAKTGAPAPTTAKPMARKSYAAEEEDEDDKRERHRMEAHLRLMGIEKPSSAETEPFAPSSSYWTGRTASKANGVRASSQSSSPSRQSSGMVHSNSQETNFRDGTPLSRLSSRLGSPDDPASPLEQGERSPRSIAAALKAFDEKEAERAKALAQGKAVTEYTSPSLGSIRRTSGPKRRSEERGMNQSGSVDTLWSIGSSQPNSGEVVLHDEKK